MPGMVAATDASGRPQLARVWAQTVDADGALVVFVARSAPGAFFEAIAARGRVAVNLIELPSYRARTFKGACRVVDSVRDDPEVVASLDALGRVLESVGMHPGAPAAMLAYFEDPTSMAVLRIDDDAIFDQTPGPRAGERL